jgi:hypothetical protein
MGRKIMKIIVNCETNEIAERELNKSEKDQQKIDEAITAQYEAAKAQQAADKAALLARLGLTEDELKTILG